VATQDFDRDIIFVESASFLRDAVDA